MYHPMQKVEIEEMEDPLEGINQFYDDDEFDMGDDDYPYE